MSHLYGFELKKGGVLNNLLLVTLCSPLEGGIQATYIVWYYHRATYRALRLLKEMGENGMVPNVASYNSTIRVLCKDEKWMEVEVLLKEMIELGLKPSISIWNMISKARFDNV